MPGKVVVLAGGVGAARFLEGLAAVIPAEDITVIGNTGDDLEVHGLCVSPDLDTVTYTLAGVADPAQGWGIAGDTFECLDHLEKLGSETWFRLGDRDLATHVYRTSLLRGGLPLSDVTSRIGRSLGVRSRILPMSDDPVRTWLETDQGRLDFQTYFVKRQSRDQVNGVEFIGAESAQPAPGVAGEILTARAVIVAPSNPIISIGPILAVAGIRDALRETKASVAAISPIVAGRALKGPTARMMEGLGMEASAFAVAELYRDFVDFFVLDQQNAILSGRVEALGIKPVVTDTVMASAVVKKELARATLRAIES
jgi:LPPG:FO 2-phospho-L-lactate transferase